MAKAARKGTDDYVPNATYPTKPKRKSLRLERAVDFALDTAIRDEQGRLVRPGRSIFITGPHGIGKTSGIKAHVESKGMRYAGLSLPTIEIPDLYLPLPKFIEAVGQVLEMHIHERFLRHSPDEEFVFVGEDARRTQPSVMHALMELTNEGSLTGLRLDGLAGVILVDNPVGEGYQNVQSGDIAYETRFAHFQVESKDIPWQEALARKFPKWDLKPVFAKYNTYDATLRRVFPPRILDHVLELVTNDTNVGPLPPMLGIPELPSGKLTLTDAGGADRTEKTLREMTEALGVPYREKIPNQFETVMKVALEKGWNVHIVGPHGVAKTATVKAVTDELDDVDTVIFSAANLTVGDLVQPVPVDGTVRFILNERLKSRDGRRKHLVFDEMFRAAKNVKPQMLELFQERSIGGEELESCIGVWAINNPAKYGALQFRVGQADEALCSRFTVNLTVTDEDTQWREWLMATYSEETVKPFLEWRAHSLDDTGRAYISPRTLEIMIQLHIHGEELENALPFLGNERLPVRLHELKALLAKKKVLGFSKIVDEIDEIEVTLTDPSVDEIDLKNTAVAVARALQKADLHELSAQEDICVRLVKALSSDLRITLIRTDNADKQRFWSGVFSKTLES